YDIRRDPTFITDFIWNNAMPVIGEPAPAIAGTSQSYIVINLNPGVTYYFAIKTQDEVGNISGLSNIVSATTQALTLNVSLSASPITGSAPLNDVDLTAAVSGTQTGSINYTFYCNRSDNGTNITAPYDAKFDDISATTQVAADVCDYINPGSYSAKVIAERGALASENRTTVTVNNPSPSTKFSINDRARANSIINVRANPSTSAVLLGTHSLGDLGIVIGGPTYADGYWWWQIDYDSSPDGWSVENFLDKVPNASNIVFLPRLEGTANVLNKNFAITLTESGINVQRAQFTRQTNASGQIIPSSAEISGVSEGNYIVVVDADYFLRKRQTNVSVISSATITLPILPAGDFNNDGIINSLDWSLMNNNWFTNFSTADINKDGIVNSLDFSWMNGNWLKADE
ncbi:MAG: dockerin type I domain-containing protein, partial [Patescibacteria group bacterium]